MLARLSHQKRLGDGGRRGKQARLRPTQVAVLQKSAREPVHDAASGQRAFISISASNRFEPNFQSSEYKAAAKQIFNRRMQYDPSKSIQENRAQLQRSGRAGDHATSEADPAKTAVHDLLLSQRRARTLRAESQAPLQARTAVKPAQPAFKVRAPDPSARATLQRRQSYIPDLKKRQLAKAAAVDSP